jgi:hypothetical protein
MSMYRQTEMAGDYQPTSFLTRKSILRDTEGMMPSWISPDDRSSSSLYDKEENRGKTKAMMMSTTTTIKKPGMMGGGGKSLTKNAELTNRGKKKKDITIMDAILLMMVPLMCVYLIIYLSYLWG